MPLIRNGMPSPPPPKKVGEGDEDEHSTEVESSAPEPRYCRHEMPKGTRPLLLCPLSSLWLKSGVISHSDIHWIELWGVS
jgi:hypothetical protein